MTRTRSRSTRHVVAVVAGVLLLLVGLLITAVGAALTAAFGTDGRLTSGAHPLTSPAVALVSSIGSIEDTDGVATAVGRPSIDVRLAQRATGGHGVFVGIGRAADVDRYLAGAPIDRVTDLSFVPYRVRSRPVPGTARPTRPTGQDFWVASATGTAGATLNWKIRDGNYRLVVMNADAAPGVRTDVRFGLTVPHVFGIGIGVLVTGVVVLVLGGVLLAVGIVGLRRRRPPVEGAYHPPPAAAGEPPPAPRQRPGSDAPADSPPA